MGATSSSAPKEQARRNQSRFVRVQSHAGTGNRSAGGLQAMNQTGGRSSTRWALAIVALVVALRIASSAQNPTDLSGKWMFVPDKSDSKPTVPRIFSTSGVLVNTNEMEITQ